MAAGDQMSPVSRMELLLSLGADDIFEVIRDAIAVAAQIHPHELEQRRDSIIQMLHAAKASSAVDEPVISVSEHVVRINSLLVGEGVSDEAVIESLWALKAVRMTFETLEATKIGRTVGGLRKHASEQVRQLAISLYKSWKAMADEHFRSSRNTSATSTPTVSEESNVNTAAPLHRPTSKPSGSNQETPTSVCRETPKDPERAIGLPRNLKESPPSISDMARTMVKSKRRFNDAYQQSAAVKKMSIRVVNVPTREYSRRPA
ncbi:hypothetical protein ACQ4PT_008986 [Festuca glaucescens]